MKVQEPLQHVKLFLENFRLLSFAEQILITFQVERFGKHALSLKREAKFRRNLSDVPSDEQTSNSVWHSELIEETY